jgi:hypothetical protein
MTFAAGMFLGLVVGAIGGVILIACVALAKKADRDAGVRD